MLFRMSICPTSGVRLAYDRISKWKIIMLRRPSTCWIDNTRTCRPAIMHDSIESSLLRFTPVLQITYYRLVESCRGQLEGEILSAAWGTPLRYSSVASFPVPLPAFRCLPYVACSMASNEKLGVGLGTRLPRT